MLANQVDEHVPLATVGQRLVQQKRHVAVVQDAVGRLDDGFEEVVGALDLVPEHHVVLAELEILDAERAPRGEPQEVQPGEHPAAAGLLLIGDAPIVE